MVNALSISVRVRGKELRLIAKSTLFLLFFLKIKYLKKTRITVNKSIQSVEKVKQRKSIAFFHKIK